MHRYLLHNDEIQETTVPLISPGQVGFMNGWGVFSTIRVSQGVLFAYQRHYNRMRRDAELMRVPLGISANDLEKSLLKLVAANNALDATLRVAIVRNKGNLFESPNSDRETDLIAFTAPRSDWGSSVKLSYVPNGRHAASPFAGTKITSWAQNLTWYEEAHERGFDEVILLNEHGQVSECTSANIFIVEGNNVWTPPLTSSGCLPGVTRALLLEEIQIPGFTIAERDLSPAELEAADQAFITSTTRDLIPVLEIDHRHLRQSPEVFDRLRQAFLHYRATYVASYSTTVEEILAK
jgi:branched-chain amino acid aminotransferase